MEGVAGGKNVAILSALAASDGHLRVCGGSRERAGVMAAGSMPSTGGEKVGASRTRLYTVLVVHGKLRQDHLSRCKRFKAPRLVLVFVFFLALKGEGNARAFPSFPPPVRLLPAYWSCRRALFVFVRGAGCQACATLLTLVRDRCVFVSVVSSFLAA